MTGSWRRRGARHRLSAAPVSPGSTPPRCPPRPRSFASSLRVLDALLELAAQDENVIGVVVHGSRGRGLHVHEGSDWDVIVVVHEPGGRYESERGGELEAFEVTSLA